MPQTVKPDDPQPAALTLFSSGGASMNGLFSSLKSLETDFAGKLSVRAADIGAAYTEPCDIAVVLFDKNDRMESFIANVAGLRERKKISIVFAVIAAEAEMAFIPHRNEVPTAHILQLPMAPADFSHAIMSGVAALKLKTDKKPGRSSFVSQAKFLGDILVEHGIIDPLQLKIALDIQKITKERLGFVLIALKYITEEQKMLFLSQQLGVGIASPRQFTAAETPVVGLIPEHLCRNGVCIALEKKSDTLIVAMEDALNLQLLDAIRDITGLTVTPLLGSHQDIASSLDRYFHVINSQEKASALVDDLSGGMEYVDQKEKEVNIDEAASAGTGAGVIKLVNTIIMNAVRDRASDIHFEPQEKSLQIRFRIDGDLRTVMSPPKQLHPALVARIKILSNLDIAEQRLPQDGRMVVKIKKREVDIRVSILPSVQGEAVVLRILDKEAFDKSVKNLGFDQHHMAIFTSQITQPHGMIVVTGPTGSGKSTTLYSAIQQIKDPTVNIVTVEDPVEFHIEGIRQVHINTGIGLSFASVLRSILRQDPDIILIGEIRDQETADIAIKMALTGHLVFSTLHTNDAVSTISRFVDIGIPPLLLSSSLNLVIAQRLVRRICPKCRTEYAPEQELLDQLHLDTTPQPKFYRGQGCVHCNGVGYLGRTGLFEMLPITREVRKLILRNAPMMEIQDAAIAEGMHTLRQSGIEKVLAGETTIEQILAETADASL
ncbi:MAG: Flp pilus assembly complex ATPase component TadA [Chitinispirillaceae bacterium]|nr:Flp pilus assembly complex ATPase component TadA [Chitinispirillaceae bacterium]